MGIGTKILVSVVVMNTIILLSAPFLGITIDNPIAGFFGIDTSKDMTQPGSGYVDTHFSQEATSGTLGTDNPLMQLFAPLGWALSFVNVLKSAFDFINAPVSLLNAVGAPGGIVVLFMSFYYPVVLFASVQFIAGRLL